LKQAIDRALRGERQSHSNSLHITCGRQLTVPSNNNFLRSGRLDMVYKPEGYTSVAPYLIVDGAQATIDFLVSVFGAEPLRIYSREDGKLQHGEVRIDDSVTMIADAIDGWPAMATNVHIYVSDVDATYHRALSRGATSVQEPEKKDDPDRRCGFRDNGGTTWWVGQQVE
jgi:PhnB protein